MLTLIASEQPRSAVYMDVESARAWRGLVWKSGPRDDDQAHWQTQSEGGTPLLIRRRPLWQPGPFNAHGEEWLVLHARQAGGEASPVFVEFNLRLTRALMDRFDLWAENVLSFNEARERLGLAAGSGSPPWDMAGFRDAL